MAPREFLTYVIIISTLMALLSLVEIAWPLQRRTAPGRVPFNLALSALVFLLNWGLVSATALVSLHRPPLALPRWLQIVVTVVLLDFCTYLAHLTMHKVPLL